MLDQKAGSAAAGVTGLWSGAPPILLPMAAYHGTLAAVRCLGAAGVRVTVAEGGRFVPGVWSRFVSRRVQCPSPEQPDRFIEWLLDFGAREPGHVLCPTSDSVAWLYARHREQLANHFVLTSPSLQATYLLLNKVRLQAAAEAVGLSMPRTWVPHNASAFPEIEAEARFPVVIKPQTQVLFRPQAKGLPVSRPQELRRTYAEFASRTSYAPCLLAHDPGVSRAAVQEYVPEASEGVYGISGFIDETGEQFAARASRKVLQQPRNLGVGLCFEEADLQPDLLSKIVALCKRVGYHGIFEAEFIARDGKLLLIDFNPRFYGQMAFDVARGLPQPLLAYEAAIGHRGSLRRRIEAARSTAARRGHVYCRSLELKLLLVLRRLFRRMSRQEAKRWWAWLAKHRGSTVDAVFDPDDRLPSSVEALHHFAGYVRHPRAFLRQVVWG